MTTLLDRIEMARQKISQVLDNGLDDILQPIFNKGLYIEDAREIARKKANDAAAVLESCLIDISIVKENTP